jgi:hypothetical protein
LHYTANSHCSPNGKHEVTAAILTGIQMAAATKRPSNAWKRPALLLPRITGIILSSSPRPKKFKLFVSYIAAIPEDDKIQPFAWLTQVGIKSINGVR